jgi:hypothetical protein
LKAAQDQNQKQKDSPSLWRWHFKKQNMKKLFTGTIAFEPSARRIILQDTFIKRENIFLVVNSTRNIPMFNFAVQGLGLSSFENSIVPGVSGGAGNATDTVLVLQHDTTTYNASDKITVIYDDGMYPTLKLGDDYDGGPNSTTKMNIELPAQKDATTNTQWAVSVQPVDGSRNFPVSGTVTANVAQGGTPVSTSNPLQVSLANIGSSVGNALIVAGSMSLAPVTAQLGGGVTETRAGNLVQVTPIGAIPSTSTSNALFVKNVNMIRLSGDTFVEERRPDSYSDTTRREFQNLANGSTATVYQRSSSARRIRLVQIMLGWNYASNPDGFNQYGRFQLEFWNDSGAWVENLFVARLQSGQLHRLDFSYGVLSPAVGGSIRINNQTPGTPINLNWFATVWEE